MKRRSNRRGLILAVMLVGFTLLSVARGQGDAAREFWDLVQLALDDLRPTMEKKPLGRYSVLAIKEREIVVIDSREGFLTIVDSSDFVTRAGDRITISAQDQIQAGIIRSMDDALYQLGARARMEAMASDSVTVSSRDSSLVLERHAILYARSF